MKKLISLILCALLAAACALPAIADDTPKPSVIATNYPLYDMARNIAGSRLNVALANEYAEGCHIILCEGGVADAWVNEQEGAAVIRAIDYATLKLDLEGNPAPEDAPIELTDTRVLTVPIHMVLCAYALAEELARLDAEHTQAYYANLDEYANAMFALDAMFREAANQQVIRGGDGSMAYFAQEYGLINLPQEERALVLNTFAQPNAQDAGIAYIELMERNLIALASDEAAP